MESAGMFMLLLNIDRHLLSLEIKESRIFQRIEHFCKATPKALPGAVIYAGDLTPTIKDVEFQNFPHTSEVIIE